jgi:putative membrane protein insertion efficiency factor
MSPLDRLLLAAAALAAVDLVASSAVAGRLVPSLTRRPDGAVRSPLAWLLTGGVRLYRAGWSGRNAGMCRFEPSCSSYALEALGRFGGVRGGGLVLYRLARCQPLSGGGFDPVPSRRSRRAEAVAAHHVGTAHPVRTMHSADTMNSADTAAGAEHSLGTRA